jgi:hypothetical protein
LTVNTVNPLHAHRMGCLDAFNGVSGVLVRDSEGWANLLEGYAIAVEPPYPPVLSVELGEDAAGPVEVVAGAGAFRNTAS